MLNLLPNFVQPLLGVPIADLATATGQISFLYVHVITLLVCIGWAVGRGSASISGEITRGTMDLILPLPVYRVTVMVVPAVVASVGAVVLALAVWVGSMLGLMTFTLSGEVSRTALLQGVWNLAAMTFCLTGVATFISSWSRDRWRAISWAGGFFVVSLIIKVIWRMWSEGDWLKYLTFLSAYRPQELILGSSESVEGKVLD